MEHAAEIRIRTVRERTTFWSRLAGLVAVIVPPVGLLVGTVLLWNRGVNLALLARARRLLRPLRARDHGRLAPVLLAQELRDRPRREGGARDPRLDGDAGAADPVGDRPPEAPRALRPARRSRTRRTPAAAAGLWERARGLWHSHVGWLFSTKGLERGPEYGKDLYDDTMIRWIDRLYLLWVVLTVGLPFAIG